MKTQQDKNARYCKQNRNNGHEIVTSFGPSNVEGADPYHRAQQVHGKEFYLDESDKKLLNFQGLREIQVHKKPPLVPVSRHMDPAYIFTLLVLRAIFMLFCVSDAQFLPVTKCTNCSNH